MKNLITESQATLLAGVSLKTLERFSETGYLTLETANDGNKFYLKNEIEKVFGIATTTSTALATSEETALEDSQTSPPQQKPTATPTTSTSSTTSPPLIQTNESLKTSQVTHESTSQDAESTGINSTGETYRNSEIAYELQQKSNEIFRLQKILEVNDKIIEIREEQYKEISSERDWLRKQVDKLEEKRDRDQLLLLSETQMLKKMVENQLNPKPSTFQQAIGWIGDVTGLNPNKASYIHNKSLSKSSYTCLLYTSPSPRDATLSRMPSSA